MFLRWVRSPIPLLVYRLESHSFPLLTSLAPRARTLFKERVVCGKRYAKESHHSTISRRGFAVEGLKTQALEHPRRTESLAPRSTSQRSCILESLSSYRSIVFQPVFGSHRSIY